MIEKKPITFEIKTERCILIGVVLRDQSKWEVIDHIDELKALAETSGAEIVESFIQNKTRPDAAYFIGKGKLEELALFIEMQDIDLVIFDDELSPAQVKNIENVLKVKVIDRAALILDIFADHARTNEAKVQVELAQLNYLLPRLTRQWQHLSRQVGGIGTKGPGETQLETDRRLIRIRISSLKKQLEKINNQKKTQRQQRASIFRAALIGYTNAGKSTIMKALTDADVLIENKLFATLDTTVRRLELNSRTEILLSDTVGFIRKLPHHLVASFRTTLAEALEADLLLHIVDITHPAFKDQIDVVNQILDDMDLEKTNLLLVFNKVDALKNQGLLDQLQFDYPNALYVSGRRHIGINGLKKRLLAILENQYETKHFQLRHGSGIPMHRFHTLGKILDERFDEEYLYLDIKYPIENKSKIDALLEKYK
ncbi:MAG: GTPase HflX [Calditrichaceae bacterium]|nr:GTPase HflX [Calditrichaceae bacterium]